MTSLSISVQHKWKLTEEMIYLGGLESFWNFKHGLPLQNNQARPFIAPHIFHKRTGNHHYHLPGSKVI